RRGILDVDAAQPLEGVELRHLRLLHPAVELAHGDLVADLDAALEDAADRDSSEIVARIEVGDEHLQRRAGVAARRRDVIENRVEQRPKILAWLGRRDTRRARTRARVENGKIELLLGGVQVDEEVVDLVQHLLHARVGPKVLNEIYDLFI